MSDEIGGTFMVYHAGTNTYFDVDDEVYLVEVTDNDADNLDETIPQAVSNGKGFILSKYVAWNLVFGNG